MKSKEIKRLRSQVNELKNDPDEESVELLENDVINTMGECFEEKELLALERLLSETKKLKEEVNPYNEEAERDMMFPNGKD